MKYANLSLSMGDTMQTVNDPVEKKTLETGFQLGTSRMDRDRGRNKWASKQLNYKYHRSSITLDIAIDIGIKNFILLLRVNQ